MSLRSSLCAGASGAAVIAAALLVACGAEPPVAALPGAITANPGSPAGTVTAEPVLPDQGAYPEVGIFRGICTATLIAPMIAMTAHHCTTSAVAEQNDLRWPGDLATPNDNITHLIDWDYVNPYAANKKYYVSKGLPLPAGTPADPAGCDVCGNACPVACKSVEYRPFAPAWLRQAWPGNGSFADANDNAYNMWGRAFDIRLLFAPSAGGDFIGANHMTPPQVDPDLLVTSLSRYLSGVTVKTQTVGTTGTGPRRFGASLQLPGNMLAGRTAGTYTLDGFTAGFVRTDPGDSGGPTLARFFDAASQPLGPRVVLGVTSAGGAGNTIIAPLTRTYAPVSGSLTDDAVRLNTLWITARVNDPDGDSFPNECDREPNAPSTSHLVAPCPSAAGSPSGREIEGYPQGGLRCPEGYLAAGVRGAYDASGLTRVGLYCKRRSCLENPLQVCLLGSAWTEEFYLDRDEGDTAFEWSCPSGKALYAVTGWQLQVSGLPEVRKLRFYCANVTDGTGTVNSPEFGPPGNGNMLSFGRACGGQSFLKALDARMRDRDHVTGYQLVCG